MEKRCRISACVITRNEEKTIERALESLVFADEIVVIDSESTDQTTQIAKRYTTQIFVKPWTGFAAQRNEALRASQGDWVFFLDSDEQASPELGKRLLQIANEPQEKHPNCYSIKRIEYFLGKRLDYGPGNPSFQWRFFKRSGVVFEGEVHEYPKFEGAVGVLDEPIHHWPDLNIEKFLSKLNHYTTLEALDRFKQGQKTTLVHALATFFSTFLKNGVRYRGFLNGKQGIVLTLLESISRVIRHLKLWVLWQVYEGKFSIKTDTPLPSPGSSKPPQKSELERPVWPAKN